MHDLGQAAQLRKHIDTISTLTNDSISDHDKEALECVPTSNQNTEMKQLERCMCGFQVRVHLLSNTWNLVFR